jgi:hypothetical protein
MEQETSSTPSVTGGYQFPFFLSYTFPRSFHYQEIQNGFNRMCIIKGGDGISCIYNILT